MADSRAPIDTLAQPVKTALKYVGAGQSTAKNAGVGQSATELRREKIRQRRSLTEEQRREKSAQIAAQLMSSEVWKSADNVLVYASYGAEVSTFELIDRALFSGKKVFCPKVEDSGMEFYRIFSREDLKPGFRGILEPDGRTAAFKRLRMNKRPAAIERPGSSRQTAEFEGLKVNERQVPVALRRGDDGCAVFGRSQKTLLIAPGTVFDREGHRIGYGGGYYDRYLGGFSDTDRPYCVGLCFSCQLTERIWPEKHDIKMDWVIFDKMPDFER